MITTVTLNPALDRSVKLSQLDVGCHNRAYYSRTDLGGKGINVSRVIHAMGYPTQALCLNCAESGDMLSNMLQALGIRDCLVPAPGRLRENLKIYDASTGEMTEINEQGSEMDDAVEQRLTQAFDKILSSTDLLVVSGSVPPGIAPGIYADFIEKAHQKHVFTVLDAAGAPLRDALNAKPDVIKPNRYEMEMLCGRKIETLDDARKESEKLIESGIGCVCLSLGTLGAMLVTENGAWFSDPLRDGVKGLQGAGDSLVAGLCIGHVEHKDEAETLRIATALAHGSLRLDGTQLCTKELYDSMYQRVKVQKL